MHAAAIPKPGGFPFGWIERLMLDEQAVFIEPERLFELDQNLFGQPVAMLLLKNQAAKQPAPDQAAHRQQQGFSSRQAAFEGTEEEREGHGNQRECPERREAHHLLATLIDFLLVQGIENSEGLLNAFRDHGRSARSPRLEAVSLS